MAEIVFLMFLTATIAFGTLAAWIGFQLHNELKMKRVNDAVVAALAEGSYRNSYRYRPRKAKK
jgi:hypothetical protein